MASGGNGAGAVPLACREGPRLSRHGMLASEFLTSSVAFSQAAQVPLPIGTDGKSEESLTELFCAGKRFGSPCLPGNRVGSGKQ